MEQGDADEVLDCLRAYAARHPSENLLSLPISAGAPTQMAPIGMIILKLPTPPPRKIMNQNVSLQFLPEHACALLASDCVAIVDESSPTVPAHLRVEIAQRRSQFGSKPAACCYLHADGRVLVVLLENWSERTIKHEMIHAAQVWCSEDAMRASFEAAAADGAKLFESPPVL